MHLTEVLESAATCRAYKPDPVPDDVLARVLDAARWAPSGGNRQPVRLIAVRDAAKRRRLKELYLPLWERYLGATAGNVTRADFPKLVQNADRFAHALDQVPVLIVVCAHLPDIYPTDNRLGRLSIVGGASVYPAVQNLLLKARDEGLGAALTTLLCAVEPEVKTLLAIPDDYATAAMLTLGWPATPFPRRMKRRPLAEVAFLDEFGAPLSGP